MFHRLICRITRLEAHHRLAATASIAALVFFAGAGRLSFSARLIATWDTYAICLLTLAWMRILATNAREMTRTATLEHNSRMLIFLFVLVSACASLGAVAYLLKSAKGLPKEPFAGHVLAAVGTVILSWLVVHTIFTLHYAYLYYVGAGEKEEGHGLSFPGDDEPDYQDFAYFSFVIGMTSQVSDVQITCQPVRRWALIHGMISFGFNAAILALSINILSGMV